MLRTAFSSAFLTPEDLSLLFRVLGKLQCPGDTVIDRETRAAALLQIFQSGICDEDRLVEAMTRRGHDIPANSGTKMPR